MASEECGQARNNERRCRRLEGVNRQKCNGQTVLVDPPRSGLDDETLAMVQGYANIVYISCNPETLKDNLAVLSETHDVVRFALFDQFPFTHHVESGVFLQKRQTPAASLAPLAMNRNCNFTR